MQLFKVFVLIFLIRNSHPPDYSVQSNTQQTYFDYNIYYYQIIKLQQVQTQITKYIILTDQEDFFIEKLNGMDESTCHLSYLQEEDKQHCAFKPKNIHFLENQINLRMLFDQIKCVNLIHSDNLNISVPTFNTNQELIHNFFILSQENKLQNIMATTAASLLATSALTAIIGKLGLTLGLVASVFMIKRQMQPTQEDFTFMIEFAEENYQRRICQGINPKISMTNLPENYKYYYLLAFTQETKQIEYISWFIQDSQDFIINQNSDENYIGPKKSNILYQIRIYFFNKKQNVDDPYIFIAKLNNKEITPLSQFTWNQ